jgi:aminoglycoside phosphotransferase
VRIDEQIAAHSLLHAMRRDIGLDDLEYVREPEPIGGGFWGEILTFRLASAPSEFAGDLVAKLTPSRVHGEREATIQAIVAGLGYPAPAVLASGSGPRSEDAFYFVMPKVDGAPPLSAVDAHSLIQAVPALALRLPHLLATLAADLHRLDPHPVQHAISTRSEWPVGVDDLIADMRAGAARLADSRMASTICALLDARPLDESRDVVCHGDFHPLNVLVAPKSATVIDWTAARIAPPAFDVAFTALLLANPPIGVPAMVRHPLRIAGTWLARRFVRDYRRQAPSNLSSSELSWHTGLHAARIVLDASTLVGDSSHPYAELLVPAVRIVTRHGSAKGS